MAEYKKIFETEKFLMKIGGLYPSVEKHLLDWIALIFSTTIIIMQVVSMFIFVLSQISDLGKLSENLSYSANRVGFICKIINFLWYGEELLKLEDTMKKTIFTDDNEEEEKLMMKVMNVSRLYSKIFRCVCFSTMIFIGSKPFYERNADGSRKLPITLSLPFDVNKYYYPISFVSVFSIGLGSFLETNMDILYVTMITVGAGRLEILKNKLENVVASGHRESDSILKQKMMDYAKELDDIYCYISTVQNIFSVGIFLQLPCCVMILCFTIFQLFMVSEESAEIVYYILYGSCIVWQLFFYAICGQMITDIVPIVHDVGEESITKTPERPRRSSTSRQEIENELDSEIESAELTDACFRARWYDCSNSTQKYFLIITERCKRPIELRPGNFFTLNLQSFVGILKTSYSYFAVLRQIYDEN